MGRRGDRDARLPAVRDDEPPAGCGELADATRFGQPADAADVGLGDGDEAPVEKLHELVAGREPLAGGDLHGRAACELRVAVEVVGPERRLDEEEVVGLPGLEHASGALDGVQGVADVDHQHKVRPDASRTAAITSVAALVRLAEAHAGIGAVEDDLELRSGEAEPS